MAEATLAYHVLRYTPNLVRDEWANIGILLYQPGGARCEARLLEGDAAFRRLRRVHPNVDEDLLRGLQAEFTRQIAEQQGDPREFLDGLNQTLSNVLQIGPRKGVLAEDFDAELDRLYREQVEPLRPGARPAEEDLASRAGIRRSAVRIFRSAGILSRLERGVHVDQFTYPGDPMHIDFAYRRNGTRGFVQALPLSRDPSHARELAFTAGCIRRRLAEAEFVAITETEPRPQEARHGFLKELLGGESIQVVSLGGLDAWARELGGRLQ